MAKKHSYEWDKLHALIPGYDPRANAGDCVFDEHAAARALDFFPACLVHIKGEKAGQPFDLEPWQQAPIAAVFGWKHPNGTRRYRELFFFVPRKNGKTILAAGISVFVFFCDGEPGAEIYCAAAERDQAALVWDVAKRQILAEPVLYQACRIYQKAIVIEKTASTFKAISADANTKHGYNAHLAVVDELHAQKNPELVDVLMTSMGSRRQPLTVYLTTSDIERESVCNERYDYAVKVRDGIIEDISFLPLIYEASKDDDWTSPDVWRKANPNYGVSVFPEYIEAKCQRAKDSPAFENTFKRLHLNIRTEHVTRWLKIALWDLCTGEGAADPAAWRAEKLLELKGKECLAGLDLGSVSDLSALSLFFPEFDILLPWFWIAKEGIKKREPQYQAMYDLWIRQGYVTMTEGATTDYAKVREDILELGGIHLIKELAVDRLFQGAQLCTELSNEGMNVYPHGQGFMSMAAPTKDFEERVINRRLIHGANPVLRWMASNVTVKTDPAGNMKPVKPARNSPLKIDGIVTSIMATGRAMAPIEKPKQSVYNKKEILTL